MQKLVDKLRRTGVIQSDAVVHAMRATDRAKYVAQHETPDGEHVGALSPYQDVPHPIGFHQTISAPHMHGHALELGYAAVKDVATPYVLDGGRVFGVDIVPALVHFAKKNIHAANGALLERGIVTLRVHNGWDGLPNEAPFHYIHVGAAADVPPQALMDQLAYGGRLVPLLDEPRGDQIFVEITRHGHAFAQRRLFGVCYVPLVRERKLS
ncbi:hypothetical protein PsorP6_002783 [Peronosclerospora sorghi]|uniref:Uncharacterized protein n=1 Tax=Peronosclerospora sorghi TaxID=230839 RepID=A0ACC0VJX9_9STRA|nr:hypothetical protein PsorP6_002783 [Peronosclerospora sorghi]